LLAPVTPVNSDNTNANSFGFNGTGLLGGGNTVSGLSPAIASNVLADDRYTSLGARLTAKLNERTSLYGEHEQATGHKHRSALGAEYRMSDKTRLYGKHEFASSLASGYGLDSGVKVSSTAIGLDTAYMKDGQLYSEYRLAGSQNGRDGAAALGVRNLWTLKPGLLATTHFEHQYLQDASRRTHHASAVALGAEYDANPLYRLGGKLELRHSANQNQLLSTLALNRKLSDNWAAIARNLYLKSTSRGDARLTGDQTQDRLQLGLAYRDTQTNRWHALARLEYRLDHSSTPVSPINSHATIGSLHANYHPSRPWTWAGQVALKGVKETIGINQIQSRWLGNLVAGRVIWDFADRFDASLYASMQKGGSTHLNGVGTEVGYRVIDNLWLSAGFTGGRYSDVELFSSNTSRKGWHIKLRYTFDEKAFSGKDPRVNRTLDRAADGAEKSPRQWRE
jgi:large repetitive protein